MLSYWRQGKSIADVVNHWIQTDPQVIALLLLEQRIEHIVFAEYLLTIVDYLEAIVPPEGCTAHLGKQMKLNQETFMDWVLERHPSALWLVGLSRELEGSRMGYYHLLHKHRHATGHVQEICHCGVFGMHNKAPKMD